MNIPRLSLQRLKTGAHTLVKTRPRLLLTLVVAMLVLAAGIGSAIYAAPEVDLFVEPVLTGQIPESAGSADFRIYVNDTIEGGTVTIEITTLDGVGTNKAVAPADYTAQTQVVTFSDTLSETIVTVPIIDDVDDEQNEVFRVRAEVIGNSSATDVNGSPFTLPATIVDNDAPTLVSISGPGNVNEDAGQAFIEVTLSGAGTQTSSPQSVDFEYEILPGATDPATPGVDLEDVDTGGVTGTLVISANTSFASPILLPIQINDDLIDEPDENFTINITSASNVTNPTLATGATLDGTIIDDEELEVFFSTSALTVTEGTAGTVQAQVSLNFVPATEVTVDFSVSGSATSGAGNDYTFTPAAPTLTFPASGAITQTIDITVLDDTIDELDETVILALTNPSANVSIVSPDEYTLTIQDDDAAPEIAIGDVTVNPEAAVDAGFPVTLTAASGLTVTVAYATADDTATAGADYTSVNGTLTFTPGITSQTINVPVLDDALDEADETFFVDLSSPASATIADAQGVGTIVDNDAPPEIAIGDVTVNPEADTNASFPVTLTAASGLTVTVAYATADDTATAGADYTSVNGTLTFTPGITSQTVNVPVLEDTLDEPDETFFVNLTAPTNATFGDDQGLGTIVDDDAPPAIAIGDVTVDPEANTNASFPVTLTAASGLTVTVEFATTDDTATAGADYTSVNGTLTFTPGITSQTINVPVLDDALDEANETFFVDLTTPTNATIADDQGLGTIVDNDDPPTISIDDVTVDPEADTTADFTVTLSAASGLTVTVAYATADGTATAGTDYTSTSGTLTFEPGITSQTISVPVLDDTLDEANETFFVDLSSPASATIADAQGVGTIVDNDAAPTISIGDVTVDPEANTNASFPVTLTAASGLTITVEYATANDTATAGADYTSVNGTVTFTPGITSQTVNVPVLEDTLDEPDETFFVNLTTPINATIADDQGLGTIVDDDDPPTINIADTSVQEGDSGTVTAVFTVTLSGASGLPVDVDYTTTDNTATVADGDYNATSGTLTFAAEEITKTISVTVNGDTDYEGNETFFVDLSNPVNAVDPIVDNQATGTIIDDDLPTVEFEITSQSVPENVTGGSATVTVTLSAPVVAGQQVTVPYSITTASTATGGGTDYTLVGPASPLIIGEFDDNIQIDLSIINDLLDENDETIIFQLGTPIGAALGTQTTYTLTIIDDDPEPFVDFAQDNSNVTEGGTATIGVSLSDPSGREVQVGYTRIGGTATSGLDYNPVSGGTLIFAPGETTQTFTVTTIQDEIDETSETVLFELSSATNANLAVTPEHTLTIDDDDGPPEVTFDVDASSAAEGTTATIDVRLTLESSRPITVTFSIGGTAPITDYTVLTTSPLVFAPGEVLKTITVNTVDNTIYQLDRTVVFSLAIDPAAAGLVDLGLSNTHTLTIEDDDGPTANFASTTASVEEANTTVPVTINLDQAIIAGDSPVLDLVISTGTTAQAGVDFNVPASITFNAGDSSASFDIAILNNELDEPDRTLVLTLSPQEGSNINLGTDITFTLTIIDDDETPVANADAYEVDEDNPLSVAAPGVLANDTDADGDTLTAEKLSDPTNGTLIFNADGSFTYTPNANFFGTDTFTYRATDGTNASGVATVTITVNSVNDAPVANDDTLTIVQNTTRPVNVLANDTDVDGDALSVDSVTEPANGTVAISGDRQAINYTPNPGYLGQDSFEYRVCDNGAPPACDTATVTVNVIEGKVYLPLIIGPGVVPPQAADLVISDFRLQPNKTNFSAGESVTVIVEVTNQGNIPVSQDFWVDFYINPEDINANPVVPTVNQRWDELCRDGAFTGNPCYYGIVWLVEDDIAPGESVTLKSTTISSLFSRWPGYFVNGTERLYVQVDSWNPGVSTGAVAESNEDNNLASILNITVSGSNPSVLADDLPTEIPPRPRP